MEKPELLDEKPIGQRGKLRRVRRWWRGMHPDRGVITRGWTGWETIEEIERVPIRTFQVARHHPDSISNSRKGGWPGNLARRSGRDTL